MAAQLSMKAALPLAKIFATAPCRSLNTWPRVEHVYTAPAQATGRWHAALCHIAWGVQRAHVNIKMSSYKNRTSTCVDMTAMRSSYLRRGISCTGKTTSLCRLFISRVVSHRGTVTIVWFFQWRGRNPTVEEKSVGF